MTASTSGTWQEQQLNFPVDDEPAWRGGSHSLPLPNETLRAASSIDDLAAWYAIGEAWAQIVFRFLPPAPNVLDIGCGCGKLARFLYLVPELRYTGVDLFLPALVWCERAFAELAGDRFTFHHFDGISSLYNPEGTILPRDYRLPAEDGSVDMTVCASLFTHLLEPDFIHYLEELRRVSKPDGTVLLSIHTDTPEGERFVGDEARIDITEDYFLHLAAQAGLTQKERIGNVYGQTVFLLGKI